VQVEQAVGFYVDRARTWVDFPQSSPPVCGRCPGTELPSFPTRGPKRVIA